MLYNYYQNLSNIISKMKKLLLYLFVAISLITGISVLAQSWTLAPSDSWSSDPSNPNASDLWDLKIRFCNDGSGDLADAKDLFLTAKPWEEKEICVYVQNTGPTPMKVGINFVDGGYTQSGDPKKACQPEDQKELFGKYVMIPNDKFQLSSNEAFQTRVKIKFPIWYAGMSNGCLTTRILKDDENAGAVKVIARRANFIDMYVDWEIKVNMDYIPFSGWSTFKNISNTDLVTLYKRVLDGKYSMRVGIKNNWNVPVLATWNVKAIIFWLIQKERHNIPSKISPQGTTYIDIDMPSYMKWFGGLTKITVNHTYQGNVPENLPSYDSVTSKTYDIQTTASAFMMPRWLVAIAVIVLLLVVKPRRKSKSNT